MAVCSTRTGELQNDIEDRTLGDVIYADKTRIRISENDWADLVRCVAAGDQSALRALYERTHRIVFTLIVRITKNREAAEELTLEVFHDVWRRAPTYDPAGGTVAGWVMNQARSRAVDRLRYERREKRVDAHAEDPISAPTSSDPRDDLDFFEQSRVLRNALAILSADERQAVETAFFSELTYSEVAAKLGQPLGTVKTRMRSGLGKMRQALARE